MELNSSLYECSVMHERLLPKHHQFRYNLFMFYFDLDEIDTVCRRSLFLSRNRFNLYSFFDRDHLGATNVKEHLRGYLAGQGQILPAHARIRLLTLPRVFGYIFNPVSFYFCFDGEEHPICAVAEVGNTFREQKPFMLLERPTGREFRLITPKNFYVSPFSAFSAEFDFRLRIPNETLLIRIDDREEGHRTLLSVLSGNRVALNAWRLAWFTIKYPLMTLKVIFSIHWEAFRIFLKRMPWRPKNPRHTVAALPPLGVESPIQAHEPSSVSHDEIPFPEYHGSGNLRNARSPDAPADGVRPPRY